MKSLQTQRRDEDVTGHYRIGTKIPEEKPPVMRMYRDAQPALTISKSARL